jgi:hypothetical protein
MFYLKLGVLNHYFDNWLLPREPEDAIMTRVILALQNILEREIELVIAAVASRSPNREDRDFHSRIQQGYGSFKSKFEWLFKKGLITKPDKGIMEAIRKIRNEHVHWRPGVTRHKLTYFGAPLLTRKAVNQILSDIQPIIQNLRRISKNRETLSVIPPRFFDDE